MQRIITPKDRCLVTAIVRDSQAQCKIVAPPEADWQQLARRIAVRTRELTRVQPVHVTPDQITDDDLKNFHLFAVGNAMNNDVIRRLYEDSFCFTDETNPGGRGCEVRTIHNPFGHRKNVVLIGGSTFEGAKRATDFITRNLHPMNVAPHLSWGGDDLAIARLNVNQSEHFVASDVPDEAQKQRLITECVAAFESNSEGFAEAMGRVYSYGYHYYQTDKEIWAEMFKQILFRLADVIHKEGGWKHRLNPPPLVLFKLSIIWDLIEESLCFSDEERLMIDNLLLEAADALEGTPYAMTSKMTITNFPAAWCPQGT
jgi:hypothetical protein